MKNKNQPKIEIILEQMKREIKTHKEKVDKLVNRKSDDNFYFTSSDFDNNIRGLLIALIDELEKD
ncbi:hypothetical protein GW931_04195 [archaeon]|nr:hypothetical protein [archaeon]